MHSTTIISIPITTIEVMLIIKKATFRLHRTMEINVNTVSLGLRMPEVKRKKIRKRLF